MGSCELIQALTSSGSGVAMLLIALFIAATSSFVALGIVLGRIDRRRQHREESRHADP